MVSVMDSRTDSRTDSRMDSRTDFRFPMSSADCRSQAERATGDPFVCERRGGDAPAGRKQFRGQLCGGGEGVGGRGGGGVGKGNGGRLVGGGWRPHRHCEHVATVAILGLQWCVCQYR